MLKQLVEKFFNISLNTMHQQIDAEVDSKKVKSNSIFFALQGKKTDGHLFLQEAIDRGAVLLVVDEKKKIPISKVPYIEVQNPLECLQDLAKFHFAFIQAETIAITGSSGKSTTKEYVSQLLGTQFKVGKTRGNQNSQIGLALSLVALEGDEEKLVLEMGMSEKGNIKKLCEIAAPNIAILTCIDVNHIEQFGSKEAIALEKSDIFIPPSVQFSYIEENAYAYEAVKKKCHSDKMIYSLNTHVQNEKFQVLDFEVGLEELNIKEAHFLKNLIPAVAIARKLQVPHAKILNKMKNLHTLEHRFQIIEKNRCVIIDDAYNSSLESLTCAVSAILKRDVRGKKIAVIGALAEQGDLENLHHQKLAEILEGKFDQIYCIGTPAQITVKQLKKNGCDAFYCESLKEIADQLNQSIQNQDLLFLKGANTYRLWELVDLIK